MSGLNPTSEALRSKHIKTLDALKGVLDENKSLKQQVAELQRKVDEHGGRSSGTGAASEQVMQIVALEAKLENLVAANKTLKLQVGKTKALEERVVSMQDAADRRSLKTREYVKEISDLQEAKARLEKQVLNGSGSAEAAAAEALERAQGAEATVTVLRQTIADLRTEGDAARKESKRAQDELEAVKASFADVPPPSVRLERARELEALREGRERLEAEVATLRSMADEAKTARVGAEARSRELMVELEFARQELQRLQEALEQSNQEGKRTAAALATERVEAQALRVRVAGLEEAAETHKQWEEGLLQRDKPLPAATSESRFTQHVEGSRKLKEQNRQLVKKIAQLQKQLQRYTGR